VHGCIQKNDRFSGTLSVGTIQGESPVSRIRLAVEADMEVLLDFGEHVVYPETGEHWQNVRFSREALRATLTQFMPATSGAVLIAIEGNRLVGFAICFLNRYFFSEDLYASDLSFFVCKDRRGSSTGPRLIAAMRAFATDRGAKELLLTVNSGIAVERAAKFLESRGARRIGVSLSIPLQ